PALVLQELDEAVSRAFGQGGEPGPAYVDFPTDTLRGEVPTRVQLDEHFRPKSPALLLPDPKAVDAAVELLWSARRPLVITGRGARGAGAQLRQLLEQMPAVYLDTGESRGLVELFASAAAALSAMVDAAGDRPPSVDREWAAGLRKRHLERVVKLRETMAHAPDGSDGRMHPNRLLAALQAKLPRDAIVVADGGDFLSFARVGLSSSAYLDPGPFGCIGVGVPS